MLTLVVASAVVLGILILTMGMVCLKRLLCIYIKIILNFGKNLYFIILFIINCCSVYLYYIVLLFVRILLNINQVFFFEIKQTFH